MKRALIAGAIAVVAVAAFFAFRSFIEEKTSDDGGAKRTEKLFANSPASPHEVFAEFVAAMRKRDISRVVKLVHTSPEDEEAVRLWADMLWIVQDGKAAIKGLGLSFVPLITTAELSQQYQLLVIGNRAELRSDGDSEDVIPFVYDNDMWKLDFGIIEYRGGKRDDVIAALRNVVGRIHDGQTDFEIRAAYAIVFVPPERLEAAAVSNEQAVELVMQLPEVRVWDTFIRAQTKDQVHGAIMAESDAPEHLGDHDYWRVTFGENQSERFHPWQHFAVKVATGEVFLIGDDGQKLWSLSQWREKQQPRPTGAAARLVTKNFEVTIYNLCGEGCVSCDSIIYHGVSKETGNNIFLVGKTMHSTGADGATPSQFLGWEFSNGDKTYQVLQDGTLWVFRGDSQLLVNEKGVWQ